MKQNLHFHEKHPLLSMHHQKNIQKHLIFDQVYSMSEDSAGGPLNSTKPLVLMIYEFAFDEYKLGRASALTVILFLLLLTVSLLQLWFMRKQR